MSFDLGGTETIVTATCRSRNRSSILHFDILVAATAGNFLVGGRVTIRRVLGQRSLFQSGGGGFRRGIRVGAGARIRVS